MRELEREFFNLKLSLEEVHRVLSLGVREAVDWDSILVKGIRRLTDLIVEGID